MEEAADSTDPITQFPTTGQPIVDTTLKSMLIALRSTLHRDMLSAVSSLKAEVAELGDRVDHMEDRMGEYAEAHNEFVDAHSDTGNAITQIKMKIADLEDRSRRNNLKFRGVAESVLPGDLKRYIHQMMTTLLPEFPAQEIVIDRAHRLPKPPYLSEHIPRDVIARIHFFHVKEKLLQLTRQTNPLPDPYAGIKLFADLSQHTLMARRQLVSVTKMLQNHKILYRWGPPAKLVINRGNKQHIITT